MGDLLHLIASPIFRGRWRKIVAGHFSPVYSNNTSMDSNFKSTSIIFVQFLGYNSLPSRNLDLEAKQFNKVNVI